MVDGVLLLVDASEGPLPQTRFVLRKALEQRLPVVLVVNKVDRPDARPQEVVNEVYELFLDLDADESQIEFPIVYANARAGHAGLAPDELAPSLAPLFEVLLETIPPPAYDPEHPLQALVTNLDASPYVGRLALLRIHHGTLRKGEQIAWCRADGTIERARVTELYVSEALERVPADEAGPGEIVALAGLPDVTIGETIADPEDPRPLPVTTVDEPSLSVTIGINTSVLSGTEGDKVTATQIKNRLEQELVGNVSLRVLPTSQPDAWEVQGRGELQLAVLVELMRREGFELTVGKPEVLTKDVDGKRCEPVERVAIDVPEDYVGVVTQLMALRKGRLQQMVNHGTGWARMEYLVAARGLDRLQNRVPHRDARHRHPPPRLRGLGALARRPANAADGQPRRRPPRSGDRLRDPALQERGSLFVKPGDELYEGMVVGENARAEDLDVNASKPKKLTNMRASSADELVRLIPPRDPLAGAGARVHPRRRGDRGHAAVDPAAQGRALRVEAPDDRVAQQARPARVTAGVAVEPPGAPTRDAPGDDVGVRRGSEARALLLLLAAGRVAVAGQREVLVARQVVPDRVARDVVAASVVIEVEVVADRVRPAGADAPRRTRGAVVDDEVVADGGRADHVRVRAERIGRGACVIDVDVARDVDVLEPDAARLVDVEVAVDGHVDEVAPVALLDP